MIYIAITIDTEGHKGCDPIGNLIYGKVGNKKYGIDAIMDVCDRYNFKAVFFVDVAEAFAFGKNRIKEVLLHIKERGHDAQLHIHPDHVADKARLFLSEYTYDEQNGIFEKCVDFYEECMGNKPIAFRAGKYGANDETLQIAAEKGIEYDFSYFYSQSWCGIENDYGKNAVFDVCGMKGVPVTVYKSIDCLGLTRYDKIDINSITVSEFKMLMQQYKRRTEDSLVVFFMHSFSFLKREDGDNIVSFNEGEFHKFEKICKYISENDGIEVIASDALYSQIKNNKDFQIDKVVKSRNICSMFINTLYRSKKLVKTNRKAQIAILFAGLLGLGAIALVIIILGCVF